MSPWERWLLRVGLWSAAGTGVGLGLVRCLGATEGEFGPEPSPSLPLWQHGHVLAAPILVLALGAALAGHATTARRARASGLAMAATALSLTASGPLIQVLTEAGPRAWAGWVHTALGAVFTLVATVHWAQRRRRRARPRDELLCRASPAR